MKPAVFKLKKKKKVCNYFSLFCAVGVYERSLTKDTHGVSNDGNADVGDGQVDDEHFPRTLHVPHGSNRQQDQQVSSSADLQRHQKKKKKKVKNNTLHGSSH